VNDLTLRQLPRDLIRIAPGGLSELSEIARERLCMLLEPVDAGMHPGLAREIEHVLTPGPHLANFSTVLGHAAQIKDREGSLGLDVGCSYGLKTIMLRYFGCDRIDACDVSLALIDGARHWSAQAGIEGLVFVRNHRCGLPFDSQRYDWVTAMGLYANLDPQATQLLFEECFRVLKPGGVFLFHDGANPHHEPTRNAMLAHHARQELGEGTVDAPDGPVFLNRVKFVLENFAAIDAENAKEIARRTCYMGIEEIAEACSVYLKSGNLPDSTFVQGSLEKIPMWIENRTPCRRPTDPIVIGKELQRVGFETVEFRKPIVGGFVPDSEVIEYYRGAPGVFMSARKSI